VLVRKEVKKIDLIVPWIIINSNDKVVQGRSRVVLRWAQYNVIKGTIHARKNVDSDR